MTTDLTFFTNKLGATLLGGFHQLYDALETVDRVRILVGLTVDQKALEFMEIAQAQMSLDFESHKQTKEKIKAQVATEIAPAQDSYETELSVQKFIEFIQSGKLEIKAYPSANLHAKVYSALRCIIEERKLPLWERLPSKKF